MPPDEAAEGVKAFHPQIVIPYHYRGSDLNVFKNDLQGTGIEVRSSRLVSADAIESEPVDSLRRAGALESRAFLPSLFTPDENSAMMRAAICSFPGETFKEFSMQKKFALAMIAGFALLLGAGQGRAQQQDSSAAAQHPHRGIPACGRSRGRRCRIGRLDFHDCARSAPLPAR